ncbi:MAG: ATP-binding cassette domain-containing protein [Elusimicrobiota bacterium]
MTLLTVKNVVKTYAIESGFFRTQTGSVKALDNISVSLETGKVLGIVGESGSGKTTLGKIICRLIQPDSGAIAFEGKGIETFTSAELSGIVQMVFQDPFASLNPKLSIGTMLREAAGKNREREINATLSSVGLPKNILSSYPHQFSGGQRQRIALARALLKQPKIIVADEPLSSLDLTIQNQLLEVFAGLKETQDISFVFISHDLAVTSNLSDYLVVMQNGKIAEEGETRQIIENPKEEYTKRLLEAVPKM